MTEEKIIDDTDLDEEEEDLVDEVEDTGFVSVETVYQTIKNKPKTTIPVLQNYEKARLIGVRAQQLANGAIPMIKVPNEVTSVIKIAHLELQQRKIPLIVRRSLSTTDYEDWKIEEFEII